MKDSISIDIDLPDAILQKLVKDADDRGILFEELVEVLLVDYADNI